MDGDDRQTYQAQLDRIESMLHRALHGSDGGNSPGLFRRMDAVEGEMKRWATIITWVGGIIGSVVAAGAVGIGAIIIKLFGVKP